MTIWNDFIKNHLLYLAEINRVPDSKTAFSTFDESFNYFIKVLNSAPEGKWSTPLIKWFSCEMYRLAKIADGNFKVTGKRPENLTKAIRS